MTIVERGGVRIHYEVTGEGPTVVLIHGAAGDRTMRRFAQPCVRPAERGES